jgi:dolichol kinase
MDSVDRFPPLSLELPPGFPPPLAAAGVPVRRIDLSRGELMRKSYHILAGLTAFAIRAVSPMTMVIVLIGFVVWNTFVWRFVPRSFRAMWRPTEHTKGVPSGIVVYCISVLALCIIFYNHMWMTAAIWGVLAFGDGMATIVGCTTGGPRLPWNTRKGLYGSLAFVLFGTLGAAALIAWTRGVGFVPALPLAASLALACAVAESLPLPVDDNITVPLAGAVALPLLAMVPFLAI